MHALCVERVRAGMAQLQCCVCGARLDVLGRSSSACLMVKLADSGIVGSRHL